MWRRLFVGIRHFFPERGAIRMGVRHRFSQKGKRNSRSYPGFHTMTPCLALCPLPSGVYILIGAGALMMLVGFLGCCGAVQESQCMLGLVSTPSTPLSHSDPRPQA